ncbi:MAG: hypothetical protein A4E19_19765 [Nitrospira sp. SG-bin1]|nr:MAG: hypothetical protein A4E19_19765 [Nitrospira sp. SG-bin1]
MNQTAKARVKAIKIGMRLLIITAAGSSIRPMQSRRGSRGPDHFATEIGAPTALFSAWTAHGMLRRMAFAHLRALVANLRAKSA